MLVELYVSQSFHLKLAKTFVRYRMDLDFSFSLFLYGAQWRKRRKIFHQFFNANVVSKSTYPKTREKSMDFGSTAYYA